MVAASAATPATDFAMLETDFVPCASFSSCERIVDFAGATF